MKTLILLSTLFFTQLTFANNFSVDPEIYDCNYAGQTSADAVSMKNNGMTLKQLDTLLKNIPDSVAKEMYQYYSIIGFQNTNSNKAYNTAYQLCMFNRS